MTFLFLPHTVVINFIILKSFPACKNLVENGINLCRGISPELIFWRRFITRVPELHAAADD